MTSIKNIANQVAPRPNHATHSADQSQPLAGAQTSRQPALTARISQKASPQQASAPIALQQMIKNGKSALGASKQILAASTNQAQADKATGKGIFAGLADFEKTVKELRSLIQSEAAKTTKAGKDPTEISPDQLGSIAQQYAYNSVRGTLINEAASSIGIKPDAIADRSTLDLIGDVFGMTGESEIASLGGTQVASQTSATAGAASGTGAAAEASAGGLASGASISAQVLGAAGAAYSGYQLIANWGNSDPMTGAVNGFTAGAYLGGAIGGGFGAAVGGVIGGVVGLVSGFFHRSGKGKDQLARDQVRDFMRENGMISQNWELQLADGSLYDIGKDGGAKLSNLDGQSSRRAYEVDFAHPLAAQTVAMLQPLGLLLTGGNKKLADDFTGYFTNAALSNAKSIEDAQLNSIAILQQLKVTPEQVVQGISTLAEKGVIDAPTAKAYVEGLAMLLGETSNQTTATDSSVKRAA